MAQRDSLQELEREAGIRDGRADEERAPDTPTDLRARGWLATIKRTAREFSQDNLTDWAAALTYYGILSIFPAILALVSVLGLIGQSATQPLINNLGAVAPGPAKTCVIRCSPVTKGITTWLVSSWSAGPLSASRRRRKRLMRSWS